jgi:hypothetical protein
MAKTDSFAIGLTFIKRNSMNIFGGQMCYILNAEEHEVLSLQEIQPLQDLWWWVERRARSC